MSVGKFTSEPSLPILMLYSTYTLSHALKYSSHLVSHGLQSSQC